MFIDEKLSLISTLNQIISATISQRTLPMKLKVSKIHPLISTAFMLN